MEKPKTGFTTRLPKFSRTSRWILLLGVFLIIFFLLFTMTNREKARFAALQKDFTNLQVAAVAPSTAKTTLQDSLNKERQILINLESQFPAAGNSVGVIDEIIKLADDYELDVVSATLVEGSTVLAGNLSSPAQTYTLQLSGEAGKIQNFILGISKFPTAIITSLTLTPSETESSMDSAVITIDYVIKAK